MRGDLRTIVDSSCGESTLSPAVVFDANPSGFVSGYIAQ